MGLMSGIGEVSTEEMTAARYARSVAATAASEKRIEELERLVEEHAYERESVEHTLGNMTFDPRLGKVYGAGWEPEDDVEMIMDLTDGSVWRRGHDFGDGHQHWTSCDWPEDSSSMNYAWPLEGGPFIAYSQTWNVDRIIRALQDTHTQERAIFDIVRAATNTYGDQTIVDAVTRLDRYWQKRWHDLNDEVSRQVATVRTMAARIDELEREAARDGEMLKHFAATHRPTAFWQVDVFAKPEVDARTVAEVARETIMLSNQPPVLVVLMADGSSHEVDLDEDPPEDHRG